MLFNTRVEMGYVCGTCWKCDHNGPVKDFSKIMLKLMINISSTDILFAALLAGCRRERRRKRRICSSVSFSKSNKMQYSIRL